MRSWYRRKHQPRSYRLLKRELLRSREAKSNVEAQYEEEFGTLVTLDRVNEQKQNVKK